MHLQFHAGFAVFWGQWRQQCKKLNRQTPVSSWILYGLVAVVRSYSGGLCLTMPHKPSAFLRRKGVARKSIRGGMTTNKYLRWAAISLHKDNFKPLKQTLFIPELPSQSRRQQNLYVYACRCRIFACCDAYFLTLVWCERSRGRESLQTVQKSSPLIF